MSWHPHHWCGHGPSTTQAKFQDAFSFCSSSLPSPGQVCKKLLTFCRSSLNIWASANMPWQIQACAAVLETWGIPCVASPISPPMDPTFKIRKKITKIRIQIQRPSSSAGSGSQAFLALLPTSSLSTGFVSHEGKARSVGVLATSAGANPCREEHPPQPATR